MRVLEVCCGVALALVCAAPVYLLFSVLLDGIWS